MGMPLHDQSIEITLELEESQMCHFWHLEEDSRDYSFFEIKSSKWLQLGRTQI